MQDERIKFIDIYRGIGIVFMIMGHIYFGSYFNIFIHAFHMPMFFLVAGFFYKSNIPFIVYVKNKIRSLLVPYFVFSIICSCLYCVYNREIYYKEMFSIIWINNNGWTPIGPMWFLSALCFALIIYRILEYIPNNLIKNFMVVTISVVGCLMGNYSSIELPWSLTSAFVAVGFIHIGSVIKKYFSTAIINRILQLSIFEIVILSSITLILIFVNGEINMRVGEYRCIPVFYFNAISSAIILWNISNKVENNSTLYILNNIKKEIEYIGRNSIVFLCFNQLIIYFFKEFIPMNIDVLIYKMIMLAVIVLTCTAINEIICNTCLKIIIHRRK